MAAIRASGMEAWLDPWGVAGIFAGEAESAFVARHPHACQVATNGRPLTHADPTSEIVEEFVEGWLAIAAGCDPTGIFWDEPHVWKWGTNGVHSRSTHDDLVAFVRRCVERAKARDLESVVCWTPDEFAPGLVVGCPSAVSLMVHQLDGVSFASAHADALWFQGYCLSRRGLELILAALRVASECARDLAVWCYKPTLALANFDDDEVWKRIEEVLTPGRAD